MRGLESESLTWADLLLLRLRPIRVLVLYFPSRFDLQVDHLTEDGLRTYSGLVSPDISVSFWDPTDPEFSRALQLFDLKIPPALVLIAGLKAGDDDSIDPSTLYMIAHTNPDVLQDRVRLAQAVNTSVELLQRGNRAEICGYLRQRAVASVLNVIAKLGSDLSAAIVALKPTLSLPGDVALSLGGGGD
jgi:hypothetical protein